MSREQQHKEQKKSEEYTPVTSLSRIQTRFKSLSYIQPKTAFVFTDEKTEETATTSTNLPEEVQAKMENSFGQDFSDVTIHKDSRQAEEIGAKAYTQGADIHFAPGKYQPQSKEGQELIGHELTHVVQQGERKVGKREVHGSGLEINVDKNLEQEADSAGLKASKGETVAVSNRSSYSIQKEDKPEAEKLSDWRKKGNLIGNVPVRNEFTVPDTNVVENFYEYDRLFAIADAIYNKQILRAQVLKGNKEGVADFNYWFAKVYSLVTKHELDYVKGGAFYYPSAVLRSVIYFEKLYEANLAASQQGGKVEEHWKKAFDTSARNKKDYTRLSEHQESMDPEAGTAYLSAEAQKAELVVHSLVQSMLAHIRFDLPRAEAWVYSTYYKNQTPSLDTFMVDFMTMGGVFDLAGYEMQKIIVEQGSGLANLAPKSGQEIAMRHYFEANMTRERADTWQRARELSTLPENQMPENPIYQDDDKKEYFVNMKDDKSYTDWLDTISTRPSMESPSPFGAKMASDILAMDASAIASIPLIERIQMLSKMLHGTTMNSAEDVILKILDATLAHKPGELATLIDGVDPWELLLDLDFSQFITMKEFLKNHYYGIAPSVSIVRLLNSSVIAWVTIDEVWEGEVILAALTARSDREAIVVKLLEYFSDRIKEADQGKTPLLKALGLLADEVMASNNQVTRLYALFGISLSENSTTPITEPKPTTTITSGQEKQPGLLQNTTTGATDSHQQGASNMKVVSGEQKPFAPLHGGKISFRFTEETFIKKLDATTCLVEVKVLLLKADGAAHIYINEPLLVKAVYESGSWHVQFNVDYDMNDGQAHSFSVGDATLSDKFAKSVQ